MPRALRSVAAVFLLLAASGSAAAQPAMLTMLLPTVLNLAVNSSQQTLCQLDGGWYMGGSCCYGYEDWDGTWKYECHPWPKNRRANSVIGYAWQKEREAERTYCANSPVLC